MALNDDIGKHPKLGSNRPTAEEVIVYESGDRSAPPDLRFIHYNDVYHVDASSAEPVGGIARFQHLVNYYRKDERFEGQTELLTFFSGDAFNPSLESSVTKGERIFVWHSVSLRPSRGWRDAPTARIQSDVLRPAHGPCA